MRMSVEVRGIGPGGDENECFLEVRNIGPRLNQDRVPVLFFDGTESALDLSHIKGIYFFNGKYYIETDELLSWLKP